MLLKSEFTVVEAEPIVTAAETTALEVSSMTKSDNEAAVCSLARKTCQYQTPTKDKKQRLTGCARCGSDDHQANDCPHKREQCFHCQKTGHSQDKRHGRSNVCYRHFAGALNMIADTGSPFSIIPHEVHLKHHLSWPRLLTFSCYLGKLPIVGELHLQAHLAGKAVPDRCSGPSLCRRDLIQALSILPCGFLGTVQSPSAAPDSLWPEFSVLIQPGLRKIQGPPEKFHLRPTQVPQGAA